MKPESDYGEMEELDIGPEEVFQEFGMLIVESRVPAASKRGLTEGPHCNSTLGETLKHLCSQTAPNCQRVLLMQKQIHALWNNNIPMCIEVVIYPDCVHGETRAGAVDTGGPTSGSDCVLIEQWIIQPVTPRSKDHVSGAKIIYQSVRSFLHFSQLSAWLNESHGTAPKNIGYRISPPGEFCTSSFPSERSIHAFPLCALGRGKALKITVAKLPRSKLVKVLCRKSHDDKATRAKIEAQKDEEQHEGRAQSPEIMAAAPKPEYQPPTSISEHNYMNDEKNRQCRSNETIVGRHCRKSLVLDQTEFLNPKELSMHKMSLSPQKLDSPTVSLRKQSAPYNLIQAETTPKQTGAIPKQQATTATVAVPKDLDLSSTHHESEHDTVSAKPLSRLPLVSPKVLVSRKSPNTGFSYTDFISNLKEGSTDSDQSSPELDKYLKNFRPNAGLEPLSPQEIQSYLCKLPPKKSARERSVSPPPILRSSITTHSHDSPTNKLVFPESPAKPASPPPEYQQTRTTFCDRFKAAAAKNSRSLSPLTRQLQEYDEKIAATKKEASQNSSSVIFTLGEGSSVKTTNGHNVVENPDKQIRSNKVDLNLDTLNTKPTEMYSNGVSDAAHLKSQIHIVKTPTSDHIDGQMTNGSPHSNGVGHMHRSISVPGFHRSSPLAKSILCKEIHKQKQYDAVDEHENGIHIPTPQECERFQSALNNSANMIFHAKTGLPLQSSPAPIKKRTSDSFDYDSSLTNAREIKHSISCLNLEESKKNNAENTSNDKNSTQKFYSASAPASTNALLGNFEESVLNGRIEPTGVVEGFTAEIGASGSFCPKHITLPVTAYFFTLSEDNAPSPYLGHINLTNVKKRGYHIPKKGTVQVTLFNPNRTVVKMFVVMYDVSDMPPNCQTFLRQRTLYMPVNGSASDLQDAQVYLRYLIHLRISSSKAGKVYLHTDIRLIFARDKFEFDSRVANYELRSFTEGPVNPKFSPKR